MKKMMQWTKTLKLWKRQLKFQLLCPYRSRKNLFRPTIVKSAAKNWTQQDDWHSVSRLIPMPLSIGSIKTWNQSYLCRHQLHHPNVPSQVKAMETTPQNDIVSQVRVLLLLLLHLVMSASDSLKSIFRTVFGSKLCFQAPLRLRPLTYPPAFFDVPFIAIRRGIKN